MITIASLIDQMKNLYVVKPRVDLDLPEYNKFHTELLDFIYHNHFQNTEEWKLISQNLIYKSSQYMVRKEGDIILEQLESLRRKVLEQKYLPGWDLVHPDIIRVSQKLYLDGHYASAACDAFIEMNDRVKKIFSKQHPNDEVPDGDAAMRKVFSAKTPIIELSDLSTETGINIQKGYMEMMAGAMSALRNPKSHANIFITADDAMRRLVFASMLMYKIDEALEQIGSNPMQE